jgi:hypothetical protein
VIVYVCCATAPVSPSLHSGSFHVLVQLTLYVLRRLEERRRGAEDEVTKEIFPLNFKGISYCY